MPEVGQTEVGRRGVRYRERISSIGNENENGTRSGAAN